MRRRRTAWTLAKAAVIGLCVTLPARGDADRALSVITPDAEAVLIVPSLSALNQQIAALRQTLDLPVAELDDVMGPLRHHMGMVAGVDEAGPVLVAMLDVVGAMEAGTAPTVALLMPVSDYGAFVENFESEAEDTIASLRMPTGQQVFAKALGSHAVMSNTRAVVEAYTAPEEAEDLRDKLGELGQRYLGEASLALYVDLDALGPAMTRLLDQPGAAAEAGERVRDSLGLDPEMLDATQVMQTHYADGARAVIQGSQSMLLAVELGDAGVAVTTTFRMREGSPLREIFTGEASQAAGGLAYLPDRPFIFALAFDEEAVAFHRMAQAMLDAMPDEQFAAVGPTAERAIDLLTRARTSATAFYVPGQGALMGGSMLNAITVYRVEDGEAYLAQWRAAVEGLDEVELETDAGSGRASGSYVDNAMQINGVQVDQYQIRLELPRQAGQQANNPFAGGMGATSYGGYIAASDNHVVMTTTTDPQVMRNALRAIEQQEGIGVAGPVAGVREQAMPPNAGVESYLSLQGVAQMANMLTQMMGGQPINVGHEVPPIAMGAGVEGDNVAFRVFVPTDAMTTIADALRQLAPMMLGPTDAPPAERDPRRPQLPY